MEWFLNTQSRFLCNNFTTFTMSIHEHRFDTMEVDFTYQTECECKPIKQIRKSRSRPHILLDRTVRSFRNISPRSPKSPVFPDSPDYDFSPSEVSPVTPSFNVLGARRFQKDAMNNYVYGDIASSPPDYVPLPVPPRDAHRRSQSMSTLVTQVPPMTSIPLRGSTTIRRKPVPTRSYPSQTIPTIVVSPVLEASRSWESSTTPLPLHLSKTPTIKIPRKPIRSRPSPLLSASDDILLSICEYLPSESIYNLSATHSRLHNLFENHKLYLERLALRKKKPEALSVLTKLHPNIEDPQSFQAALTELRVPITWLMEKCLNLWARVYDWSGEAQSAKTRETLERALWTIWDFNLTFQDSKDGDRLEWLKTRYETKELFPESQTLSRVWMCLNTLLYPLHNITKVSDEMKMTLGVHVEAFIDFFCAAGLDHLATVARLVEHSTVSGRLEAFEYMKEKGIISSFQEEKELEYRKYWREPVRQLCGSLDAE